MIFFYKNKLIYCTNPENTQIYYVTFHRQLKLIVLHESDKNGRVSAHLNQQITQTCHLKDIFNIRSCIHNLQGIALSFNLLQSHQNHSDSK